MKIVILGAGGFIGRNLVEYFSKNHDVVAVYSYNNKVIPIDGVEQCRANLLNISDIEYVVKECDVMIQAAATTFGSDVTVNKPYVHVTDNAVMNSLILRATVDNKVGHFIFPSCSVMYPSKLTPQTEDIDFNIPITPKYLGVGSTKVYLERMCKFYSEITNTKFTVIRHSNNYGPYDKYELAKSHVFGGLLRKIIDGTEELEIWGDGQEGRDFLYVADLIKFVELAIEKQTDKYQLFNVGSGKLVKIEDLAKLIMKVVGKDLAIRYNINKPTIPVNIILDAGKAKGLGWEQEVGLEEGIARTFKWYKENFKN